MTIQFPLPHPPRACRTPPPLSPGRAGRGPAGVESMAKQIRKVGVLGAGVMGSGIAAHVAGAGYPVLLLDIVPPFAPPAGVDAKSPAWRNKFTLDAKEKLLKAKPNAYHSKKDEE